MVLRAMQPTKRFERDYRKLEPSMQDRVDEKLRDMMKDPRPPGLAFEKLSGLLLLCSIAQEL